VAVSATGTDAAPTAIACASDHSAAPAVITASDGASGARRRRRHDSTP
jgi:hypothetical protein